MAQQAAARLRERIPEIMQQWEDRVRAEVPAARHQQTSVLHDHLTEMLEVMAKLLAGETDPDTAALDLDYIITHGTDRAGISAYTLEQMILECQVLQEVVFTEMEAEHLLDLRDRVTIIAYLGGVLRQAAGAFARTQQQEARARDAIYRMMVEEVRDHAIFLIDRDGRVERWNAGAQRITGFTEEEIVGQPCDILFTPEDRAKGVPQKELSTAAATGRAGDDRWQMRKDGTLYWAQGVTSALSDDAGNLIGFCKVMRDGTRQKELEDALRARVEELNHADRAKDQFLAMLGHELRNPLGAASNAVHLLQMSSEPAAPLQKPLKTLQRQLTQMGHLVDDLLDVARVTQGKVRIEKRPIKMDSVVAAVLRSWETQIQTKGLEARYEGDTDILVAGDAFRLEQIVANLLNNALKYTDSGTISVSLRRSGDMAELRISDTGIGIDADTLPHVFELFSQGSVSLDRSQGGLGVGLTIVQQVVELHGGHITAESPGHGMGSTFTVTLPLWTGEDPQAAATPPAEAVSAVRPLRVLVVEDNQDAADALVEILEAWGHTAVAAYSGRAALDAALELGPDVVLLDIGLPEMDGYAVAAWLRKRPEIADTRVIALTGYGQADDLQRLKEAGFDGHLLKPADLKRLQALLNDT